MIYLAPDSAMNMNKPFFEKLLVILMFLMVLVVFSFAERDTKKLVQLYSGGSVAEVPGKAKAISAISPTVSTPKISVPGK